MLLVLGVTGHIVPAVPLSFYAIRAHLNPILSPLRWSYVTILFPLMTQCSPISSGPIGPMVPPVLINPLFTWTRTLQRYACGEDGFRVLVSIIPVALYPRNPKARMETLNRRFQGDRSNPFNRAAYGVIELTPYSKNRISAILCFNISYT